jgi:hypothetical protein
MTAHAGRNMGAHPLVEAVDDGGTTFTGHPGPSVPRTDNASTPADAKFMVSG